MDLNGQRVISPEDLGAVALSSDIQHVVGAADALLNRPTSMSVLVMEVESGSFRVQLGSEASSSMDSAAPAASVTDGSGSHKLVTGRTYVFSAPVSLMVVGSGSTAVLTYWWLP